MRSVPTRSRLPSKLRRGQSPWAARASSSVPQGRLANTAALGNSRVLRDGRESSEARPGYSGTIAARASSSAPQGGRESLSVPQGALGEYRGAGDFIGPEGRPGAFREIDPFVAPTAPDAPEAFTRGRYASEVGRAAADVDLAHDQAAREFRSGLSRYGLRPGSGRFAGGLRSLALARAGDKASGMAGARRYLQGREDMLDAEHRARMERHGLRTDALRAGPCGPWRCTSRPP